MTFLNKLNTTRVKIFACWHLVIAVTSIISYSSNVRRTFFYKALSRHEKGNKSDISLRYSKQ